MNKHQTRRTVSLSLGKHMTLKRLAEKLDLRPTVIVETLIGQAAARHGIEEPSEDEVKQEVGAQRRRKGKLEEREIAEHFPPRFL